METLRLLKTRRFLPYFVTQFGGAFNDSLIRRGVEMLIAFQGLSGTLAPETAIFLLLGLFISPFFFLSASAGFLADTKNKTSLVKIIKTAEILIVAIAAYGICAHILWICAAGVFALGIHSTFFGPIKFSLPPHHLATDELIAANGLIEAGTNMAILLGTILGSVLVARPGGEVLVSLLGMGASVVGLAASFFILPAPAANAHSQKRLNTFTLLARLYRDDTIFRVTLGISWFWTLGAILISLFSLIVKDSLHAPQICVSVLFAVFSIGVGAGSLLCNRILRGVITATWVPLASLGMAVSLFVFYVLIKFAPQSGVTTSYFFMTAHGIGVLVSLLTLSMCAGLYIVPLYGLLQSRTSAGERSQMVAANNILNAFLMVIGSVGLTALFAFHFSIGGTVLLLSIINVVAALYTCLLLPDALIKSILQTCFRIFFRARVTGLEHIADAGPRALFVSNHLSFLDAVMLGAFIPERVSFAVNTEISKRWWMKPVMVCMDIVPIDSTGPMAVRLLIDRLKENKKVVIFPEGRITVTGALMKVYEGPAMIADKADAVLIPVRLDGFQYTIFSRISSLVRWKFFPKLSLTVCPPTKISVAPELKGRKRREMLALALHDLMTELMFATAHRGPTLLHALQQVAQRLERGKEAVLGISGKATYRQVFHRSFLLSRMLPRSECDYVGLLLPSDVPLLLFFFAVQWKGKTPALLNYGHSPEQMAATCKASALTTVVTSRKFVQVGKLERHIELIRAGGTQIVYVEELRAAFGKVRKFRALADWYAGAFCSKIVRKEFIPGAANDSAAVLFTSGSEGMPKGVVLSHHNLLSNIEQVTSVVPLFPADKIFNALPMFHSFGLTGGTLMPLMKGNHVTLYPSPLHYRVIPELIYNDASTVLFGTPTFLAGYAKKAHPYDFFNVRYVFSGAERLSEAVRSIYQERFGIRIFEGYGATETSPVIAVNTPFHTKRGTVGRLVPGMEYRLEEVPGIAGAGRLFVKGPNVMMGYLRVEKPGVLQRPNDEWYDTGDIVCVDAGRFITIQGRAKRFAKIGGEMVSLAAVEQALEAEWPFALHAVISLPDPRKGEKLILVSTLADANRESVADALKKRGVTELSIPRDVRTRSTLPLLGSGKIDIQTLTKDISADVLANRE